MLIIMASLIKIHLARNPANGGKPARFAIIIIRIIFSFLEWWGALIFFCLEFFTNMITISTEVQ
jgi:hypothetical protein